MADRVYPRVPWQGIPGLALAMRLCRDVDGGEVTGLAQVTRRVPDGFVGRVCVLADRAERWAVSCVCGAVVFVATALVECRCGRWLVGDRESVYAIRLGEQEAEAA